MLAPTIGIAIRSIIVAACTCLSLPIATPLCLQGKGQISYRLDILLLREGSSEPEGGTNATATRDASHAAAINAFSCGYTRTASDHCSDNWIPPEPTKPTSPAKSPIPLRSSRRADFSQDGTGSRYGKISCEESIDLCGRYGQRAVQDVYHDGSGHPPRGGDSSVESTGRVIEDHAAGSHICLASPLIYPLDTTKVEGELVHLRVVAPNQSWGPARAARDKTMKRCGRFRNASASLMYESLCDIHW
jgi:hypothetical protein